MEQKIPQVVFENVEKLTTSTKKVLTETGIKYITKVSFEAETRPQDLARLHYFAKQKPPTNVIVEHPQAEFDLNITPVNVTTGEIAPAQVPDFLK